MFWHSGSKKCLEYGVLVFSPCNFFYLNCIYEPFPRIDSTITAIIVIVVVCYYCSCVIIEKDERGREKQSTMLGMGTLNMMRPQWHHDEGREGAKTGGMHPIYIISTSHVFWKIWGKKTCGSSSRSGAMSGRSSLQGTETEAVGDTVS